MTPDGPYPPVSGYPVDTRRLDKIIGLLSTLVALGVISTLALIGIGVYLILDAGDADVEENLHQIEQQLQTP